MNIPKLKRKILFMHIHGGPFSMISTLLEYKCISKHTYDRLFDLSVSEDSESRRLGLELIALEKEKALKKI